MWGLVWSALKGIGSALLSSGGSGAATTGAGAAANAAGGTVANAAGGAATDGIFSKLGTYLKSDTGRGQMAGMADQAAGQAQQQAQSSAQAGQSAGMSAMNGNTIQPTISSTPIGMSSQYDPERLKRLMRLA